MSLVQEIGKYAHQRARLTRRTALLGVAAGLAAPSVRAQTPTVVKWWTWDPVGKGFVGLRATQDVFIAAFQKLHPEIRIDNSFWTYGDYLNNLRLGMLSDSPPDVIGLQPGALMRAYADLTEDLRPLAQKTWGAAWKDRFYAAALTGLESRDGEVRGLPQQLLYAGIFWANQTLLQQNGLGLPKTMDDLTAMAKVLNPKGLAPILLGGAEAWQVADIYLTLANAVAPGRVYEAAAGRIPFTDPALIEAMTVWKRLFDDRIVQSGAVGTRMYGGAGDANTAFVTGKGALSPLGTWNARIITRGAVELAMKGNNLAGGPEAFGLRVPIFFPAIASGSPAMPVVTGTNVWSITGASKVKEAAWTFIAWLLDAEGGQKLYANSSDLRVPAVKGVELDYSDAVSPEQVLLLRQILEQAPSRAAGLRDFNYPELGKALLDAGQAVGTGQKSPQRAMADVEAISRQVDRG